MKKLSAIIFSILFLLLANTAVQSQVTFNKTYGQMPYNYGKRILQAWDGGYYLLANENGDIANTNIHIIRIDSLGVILFERTIGDASIYSANDFIRTADKGLLITGLTNKHPEKGYDVLLVKTDSNAVVQWEKTYGGADWDMGNSVIETKDNAYLISGQTFSYGPGAGNIYIIKTNLSGDTLWTKVFGGDSTDYAMSADNRYDSTYLIGATTGSFGHGNLDGYVLNLDLNGDTLWTQTYGEDKEDVLNSIKETRDSGYIFVGTTMSYNVIQHDFWLMRFDKNKNFMWKIPEPWISGPADDYGYSVTLNDSAQFVMVGSTTGVGNGGLEISFVVMTDYWNFICSASDGSSADDEGYYAIQTKDKGYIVIGNSKGYGTGISNIYVLKFGPDCSKSSTTEHVTDIEETQVNEKNFYFGIYPNISNGRFYLHFEDNNFDEPIKIMVTNLIGKIIFSDSYNPNNSSEYLINIANEAAGMYFVTVSNNENKACLKVVKQ
ncbi:MAG: T9SS type A sorting domain-containing protein [Bacteroidota bacterium]